MKKKRTRPKARDIKLIIAFLVLLLVGICIMYSYKNAPRTDSKDTQTQENKALSRQTATKKKVKRLVRPKGLKIPVLMFHHIRDPKLGRDEIEKNLSVSPRKFRAELQWLETHGYQAVSIDSLRGIFSGQVRLAKKPVVLTFDDGYRDNFTTALPALQSAGMIGNFFVITGAVGNEGYVTKSQLKKMNKENMTIGSHTVSHPDLSIISFAQQKKELSESKVFLKHLLGHDVSSLCYPSGEYSLATINIAKSLGYKAATTTRFGWVTARSSFLQLPRVRMTQDTYLDGILK